MANMIDNQLEVRGREAAVHEFLRKTLAEGEPDLLGACRDHDGTALGLQRTERLRPGLYDIDGESRQLYCFRTKWRPPHRARRAPLQAIPGTGVRAALS